MIGHKLQSNTSVKPENEIERKQNLPVSRLSSPTGYMAVPLKTLHTALLSFYEVIEGLASVNNQNRQH